MMTVHKLSAGDGYRYYTGEVASADMLRDKNRELGDYYTVTGMPPGQWVGSGASELALFGQVKEAQMKALFSGQQLPVTSEELAELLAQKPDKSEAVYALTLEEKRLEYATKAWDIHLAIKQGRTLEEVGNDLLNGISHQAVSKKIEAYKTAGNDFSKANKAAYRSPENLEELKVNFLANYKMTETEQARAQKAASHAAGKETGALSRRNAEPAHTFDAVKTPYTKKLAEEKARFLRQNDREPTKEEAREIRNRVAGQTFREEHRREPRSKEELKRWIASQSKPQQQTVAGFDLVFTPTKSVSIAWGLGDETLRKGIETAHEKAIQDVVAYLEKNVIYTRRGKGGIAQEDVKSGIIATKFRHYDSRNGDPNLHDHLVIANKVQGQDGRWLTLDGRMLYAYNVAASELYNSKIAEHIHADLGLEFVGEERKGRMIHELAGLETENIQAFSSRSSSINKAIKELVAKYIQDHGYPPNNKVRIALRQQAALATRPHKDGVHSLAELNTKWRQQVQAKGLNLPVGEDLYTHLQKASTKQAEKVIEAKAQALATGEIEHAEAIIERLQTTRSTWKITHIQAETERYFRDMTSGSGVDRKKVLATIAAVKNQSVSLNNFGEAVELPAAKLRQDGTSVYRRADYELFSSHAVFSAERSLINAATVEKVIPVSTHDVFDRQVAQLKAEGGRLSSTQEDMARAFVTDERLLVVGIGPAGAGKTTSMKAAVDTARASGHRVIGLAPTAVAASIMEKELDIEAMTVAKFTSPLTPGFALNPGDVLLVDEIGMASTLDLAKIVEQAREQGALVRGIGDYRQLSAIGSGGALRLIESEAGAIYLEDVFRFKNQEEAAATLALREPPLVGTDKPFDWYLSNERITAGDKEIMLADVYAAWAADTAAGKHSLMLAPSNDDVKKLNQFAQTAAIDSGTVKESKRQVVELDDGTRAFRGDVIVTRKNDYKLKVNNGKDFVKNGDSWRVKSVTPSGEIKAVHTAHGGVVTLPAEYVSEYVQLGYASTISRAQGATVDTVHAVADSSTTRANAYVALSRGRESNRLYVATTEGQSRDDVLGAITNNFDRNLSFHEETRAQRAAERNVAAALEKYDDLSLHASEEAMKSVVTEAIGENQSAAFFRAPAWGALAHELADTYRSGLDPVETFTRAYQQRDLEDAEDVSAVLHWRIQRVRAADEAARERFGKYVRPMAHIPDEQLDQLIARAKERTKPLKEREIEDKRWIERDYALVPSDRLKEMRVNTVKALDVADSTGDTRGYAEISENLSLMNNELARRRWSSPEQKAVEEIVRGERPRSGADFTILNALKWEKRIRESLIPEVQMPAPETKDRIVKGVSGHSLDSFWQYDQYTPDSLKRVLKAQHREVAELVQLRGKQLAAEKPAWTEELGQVPARTRNARHWFRVAAEVEAFREKYKVPAGETEALPKDLVRGGDQGKFLKGQITDVHKRYRLSSTLKSEETLHENLSQQLDTRMEQETASEAEQLMSAETARRLQMLEDEERALTSTAKQLDTLTQSQKDGAQTAQNKAQKAQEEYQKAQERLKELQGEIMTEARTDFAHLQKTKEEADSAGMFARRKLNTAYEEQLKSHIAKWGTDIDPAQDPGSYLRSRQEYRQLRSEAETLKHRSEQASVQAQTSKEKVEATQEQRQLNAVKLRDNRQKQRALRTPASSQEQQKQVQSQARKEQEREAFRSRSKAQERQR